MSTIQQRESTAKPSTLFFSIFNLALIRLMTLLDA